MTQKRSRDISDEIDSIVRRLREIFKDIDLKDHEIWWWKRHYTRIIRLFFTEAMPCAAPRSPSVLEIGTGFGLLASMLGRLCNGIVSTEHIGRSYVRSSKYLSFLKENKVAIILQELNEGLPFRDRVFDVVFCCDVIEHLKVECAMMLIREIKRVLRDDGIVIFSTPNLSRLENRCRLLFNRSPNPPVVPVEVEGTYDHIREFTITELSYMFSVNGLEIMSMEYGLLPVFHRDWGRLTLITSAIKRLVPSMRDEIYGVLRGVSKRDNT